MHTKQTMKKFDTEKLVLPLKFMSLSYIMVTLRSKKLVYMSTPHRLMRLDRVFL